MHSLFSAFKYRLRHKTQHMKKILIIAISFLLVTNGFSQNEDSMMIKKISDEILTNGKAYDNLHYLTKQIGGRLSARHKW